MLGDLIGDLVSSPKKIEIKLYSTDLEFLKETAPAIQAQIDEIYARAGALTPNDLRANIGLTPFSQDSAFANKPLAVALLEMQLGLRAGGGGVKPAEALLDRLLEIRAEVRAQTAKRRGSRKPCRCEGGRRGEAL